MTRYDLCLITYLSHMIDEEQLSLGYFNKKTNSIFTSRSFPWTASADHPLAVDQPFALDYTTIVQPIHLQMSSKCWVSVVDGGPTSIHDPRCCFVEAESIK